MEFVLQQSHVKLPCCINASHCQGERGDEHNEAFQAKRRRVNQRACCSPFAFCVAVLLSTPPMALCSLPPNAQHRVLWDLTKLPSQHRCAAIFFLQPPQSTSPTTSPNLSISSAPNFSYSHTRFNSPRFTRRPLKPFSRLHNTKVGAELRLLALSYITFFAFAGNFGPPAMSTMAFPHKSSLLNTKTSRFISGLTLQEAQGSIDSDSHGCVVLSPIYHWLVCPVTEPHIGSNSSSILTTI